MKPLATSFSDSSLAMPSSTFWPPRPRCQALPHSVWPVLHSAFPSLPHSYHLAKSHWSIISSVKPSESLRNKLLFLWDLQHCFFQPRSLSHEPTVAAATVPFSLCTVQRQDFISASLSLLRPSTKSVPNKWSQQPTALAGVGLFTPPFG